MTLFNILFIYHYLDLIQEVKYINFIGSNRRIKTCILLGLLLLSFFVSIPKVLTKDTLGDLIISVQPEKNFIEMSPERAESIVIYIENLGNNKTEVFCKILNITDGWNASISDSVIIGTGNLSKSPVVLTIVPPYSFGYHDDKGTILISFTPSLYGNPSIMGREITYSIRVESNGFVIPGIEIFFAIIVIIGIITIILIIKKYNKKY